MAEAKRIELTTVGSLKKERKAKESRPTHRFQLTLGESNEKTCPEYSYPYLLKSVGGSKPTKNGSIAKEDGDGPDLAAIDPFAEEDDNENEKLKAMAQQFEEKYAPKPAKKPWRNKVGRMEDYIDLGMGYDETDPFIDNTDAYDELVPSTLTTQFGGFYINSGKLDFKEVQSESSSEEDAIQDPSKKRKKRRLMELEKDKIRRKKKFMKDGREGDLAPKKRGRKPLDRMDGKKQPTVAVLLQHHKAQQRQQSPQPASPAQPPQTPASFQQPQIQATIAAELALVAAGLVGTGDLAQRPEGSIHEIIESVVGAVREKEPNCVDLQQNSYSNSSSSESDDPSFIPQTGGCPKLPEGLPDDMDEAIKHIKVAALKSAEGKCKFFSHEVNNILLNIELMSRDLSCSQRSTVYGHLASHLPCTKETLLKRAKKLRIEQEDIKLREPMRRLKQAIDEIMPGLEETYKSRCLVASEGGVKIVKGLSSGDEEEKGKSLEYFFDEENDQSSQEEEYLVEGVKLIRRKFQWSDKIRKLLCDVVQIKMKCFEVTKMRTQSAEEYLKYFLETEVKQSWPKGWMTIRKLVKETRLVHAHLTYRPKRNLLAVKKLLPAISLLPLSNISLKTVPADSLDSLPHGATLLKTIQLSCAAASTPLSSSAFTPAVSAPSSHQGCAVTSSLPSALALPHVSITSAARTIVPAISSSLRDPDTPTIVVTPVSGKSVSQVVNFSGGSSLQSPSVTSVIQSVASSSTGSSLAFQPSSKVPSVSVIATTTTTAAVAASPLESPGKSNRIGYKSLFDTSVVSALASGECVPKFGTGGMSSAKDILSEIINKSLAGYSNSDKLSGSYKYQDSPKFAAFLSKPFVDRSGNVGAGNHAKMQQPDSKTVFPGPRKSPLVAPSPTIKSELHSCASNHAVKPQPDIKSVGYLVPKKPPQTVKSEFHGGGDQWKQPQQKDERHGVQERSSGATYAQQEERRSSGAVVYAPQDLRTQSRPSVVSGGVISSQKAHHKDLYLPVECLTPKMTAVPFHSLYDMQGAIERGLQSQSGPSPLSVLSPGGGIKVKSRSGVSAPSPKSNYYAGAPASDQPLNFSTPRQSVAALDRSGGSLHGASRNITPPQQQMNLNAVAQERSRGGGSSPISPSSSAVRMVSLPHHQPNKYSRPSNSSPLNEMRSRTPQHEQVYLEGIAASFQEFHYKKVQHRNVDPPTTNSSSGNKSGTLSHSELNNRSPPGGHVLVNHNLPKAPSTYSEPVHSISQGCTDIPFHHYPRFVLPPTLQGNSSTP